MILKGMSRKMSRFFAAFPCHPRSRLPGWMFGGRLGPAGAG
jgi:hypothetical protein